MSFSRASEQRRHCQERLQAHVPTVLYQGAYYSNEKDVPERAREYAGRDFRLESCTVPYLLDFDGIGKLTDENGIKQGIVIDKAAEDKAHGIRRKSCGLRTWEICVRPPRRSEVEIWLGCEDEMDRVVDIFDSGDSTNKKDLSQIDAATQKNRHGFKYS